MAVETEFKWIVSGPVEGIAQEALTINFLSKQSIHSLKVETYNEQESLDIRLRRFWELESLGILKNELRVYEKFTQQISFKQGRYEVQLPWTSGRSRNS